MKSNMSAKFPLEFTIWDFTNTLVVTWLYLQDGPYFITNSILIVLWHWFSLLVANRNVNWLKTKEEAFKQSIANYIFLRPGDEMSLVGNEKYAETTQQLPSHVQYTSPYQSQYTLPKCKWSRQLLQSERGLPISNSLFGTLPQDNGNSNRHNNNNNNNNNDDVE